MTDPNQIVPKLLRLKHENQVRQLGSVMAQLKIIEAKQDEIAAERDRIDHNDLSYTRLSLQNGYGRYLQVRSDALRAQAAALKEQARALQQALKETMASQSILSSVSQP